MLFTDNIHVSIMSVVNEFLWTPQSSTLFKTFHSFRTISGIREQNASFAHHTHFLSLFFF